MSVWRPHDTATPPRLLDPAPGRVTHITLAGRAEWSTPCVGATAFWTPDSDRPRWLPPSWSKPTTVSLSKGAPVAALVGTGDTNLCAVAVDEGVASVLLSGGVVEETGEFAWWVEAEGPVTLRIDRRPVPFARALADVAAWWGKDEHHRVPATAWLPVYCTWYALHQSVTAEAVERQAALAAALGCATLIVDDGWQTTDDSRGYGTCGDWRSTFPDMADHVRRVHDLGLAYVLWYALPFLGRRADAWPALAHAVARDVPHLDAGVLDPRLPEARAHLVDRLSAAVAEWGVDGLKVDFVDTFGAELSDGLLVLLRELDARLRAHRPDVLVEHRQNYVSPALWPYATMVRAADCPLSPTENRQRIVDLRLVSGPLPVHGDPLMWHPAEPPEGVAAMLIGNLFGVPQISVDLERLTAGQSATVAFWLGVIREHGPVLHRAELTPSRPELGYPQISASDGATTIVGRYAPLPVRVPSGRLLVANADPDEWVLLTGEPGRLLIRVRDCRGRAVDGPARVDLDGHVPVRVPLGGLLEVTRVGR
ncbi:glycoside hydrolase family 36 protein [Longispora sp. K20-0274]|uniref:glycoside hydrolase family 36 protein n=1 Tax=Longispora sp. K20-0274 TaxID=3088255 RepID=UPI00399AFD8B